MSSACLKPFHITPDPIDESLYETFSRDEWELQTEITVVQDALNGKRGTMVGAILGIGKGYVRIEDFEN